MNIREELLKEKVHTKAHATEITSYACSSPAHFKELMDCFLLNDYRVSKGPHGALAGQPGLSRN